MSHTEKVQEIIAAAIEAEQTGKAHVFVNYAPHINAVTVYAYSANTDYQAANWSVLFGSITHPIYLEWDDAKEKLEATLTKIKEL